MKKYRIRPGAKKMQGNPLMGSICFACLGERGGNSRFMRVTYSHKDVSCGVVLESEESHIDYFRGRVLPVESSQYDFYPAEEIPQ